MNGVYALNLFFKSIKKEKQTKIIVVANVLYFKINMSFLAGIASHNILNVKYLKYMVVANEEKIN